MTGGVERSSLPLAIRTAFVGDDPAVADRVEALLGTADDITVSTAATADSIEPAQLDCLITDDERRGQAHARDTGLPVVLFVPEGGGKTALPDGDTAVAPDDATNGLLDNVAASEVVRERHVNQRGEPLRTRLRNVVARGRVPPDAAPQSLAEPGSTEDSDVPLTGATSRSLFENAPSSIAFIEYDDGPKIRRVNAAFEATFGIDRTEAVGRNIDHIVTAPGQRADAIRISESAHAGDLTEAEVTRQTVDGPREFRLRLIPVDNEAESADRRFAVYTDITERKRREEQLHLTNERISRIHGIAHRLQRAQTEAEVHEETVGAAIDILEFDWCATTRALDDRFEIVARSGSGAFEGDDEPFGLDEGVGGRVYQSGETAVIDDVREEAAVDPPDDAIRAALTAPIGKYGFFQALSSTAGAFDENDRELVELLVTHTQEAFERLDREAELERMNDRVSKLHAAAHRFQSAEDEAAVYDETVAAAIDILEFDWCVTSQPRDGRFELTAASEASPFRVGEAPLAVDEGTSSRAFDTGETDVTDDVLADADGNPVDEAIRSALTVPMGRFGIFQAVSSEVAAFDEHDRELAELLVSHTQEALEWLERTAELEQQNERLDQFASAVSHDLRNPLNVAQGRVRIASETGELTHLEDAEEALGRMNSIIDDVLALAREQLSVDPAPVDIDQVAWTAWSMVDTASASLAVEASGSLLADDARLHRLLENLFRNCIEHGDADTVTVEELVDGFAVVDDGVGFADGVDAFRSGESTGGGTGLGLAIVRRIAEAHDWQVTAANGQTGARIEVRDVEEV